MMRQHTRLIGWLLAVSLMLLFCWLGRWQLSRMHEKQGLLDAALPARQQAVSLQQALDSSAPLHWVQAEGRFLPPLLLLDNQLRHGRAGLRVYQPFAAVASNAVVLVDLGWLPMPPDRSLPAVTALQGGFQLQGLLVDAPATGLALGPALVPAGQPDQWLATRIDMTAISTNLELDNRDLAPRVLRLDPAIAVGFERDLELLPNTLPPAKHLGYAVQWFALAAAVLLIALLLEWRRRFPRRAR